MDRRIVLALVCASLLAGGAIPGAAHGAFSLVRTFPNDCAGSGQGGFGRAVAFVRSDVLVGSGEDAACLYDGATGNLLDNFQGSGAGLFGFSVAGLAHNALVGAAADTAGGVTGAGAVQLFDGLTGALILTIPNPTPVALDRFGISVAASGADVLVGAPLDDTGAPDAGAAYLFASNGSLLLTFANPSAGTNDQFGRSVASRYDHVLIGANGANGGSGAVYLFDRNGVLVTTFVKPGTPGADDFGRSVAAVGDHVLVGAPGADSAYLFDGLTYALKLTLSNPGGATSANFGHSVAAVGDDILVGSAAGAAGPGAVYLFDGETGHLLQTIANPTPVGQRCVAARRAFGCPLRLARRPGRMRMTSPMRGAAASGSTTGSKVGAPRSGVAEKAANP